MVTLRHGVLDHQELVNVNRSMPSFWLFIGSLDYMVTESYVVCYNEQSLHSVYDDALTCTCTCTTTKACHQGVAITIEDVICAIDNES